MKIKVPQTGSSAYSVKLISIITEPHNVQFHHADKNLLFFRISKYPTKEIKKSISEKEHKEFSITDAFIRAAIKRQSVNLCFVVQYQTKTENDFRRGHGVRSQYTITEKEAVFVIDAEKDEIIQFVDPYIWHIKEVNARASADLLIRAYNEWAYPITLESVIDGLTEDQKITAAKLLYAYFVA